MPSPYITPLEEDGGDLSAYSVYASIRFQEVCDSRVGHARTYTEGHKGLELTAKLLAEQGLNYMTVCEICETQRFISATLYFRWAIMINRS